MPAQKFLEIARKYLFEKEDAIPHITENQLAKLRMFEDLYTRWLADPNMPESNIINLMTNQYGLSLSSAYRAFAELKTLHGNVLQAKKEWARYKANALLDEAVKYTREAVNSKDLNLAKADRLIKIAKAAEGVNGLSRPDSDPLPFDQIMPQSFEPVYNPALLESKRKSLKEIRDDMLETYKELGILNDIEPDE